MRGVGARGASLRRLGGGSARGGARELMVVDKALVWIVRLPTASATLVVVAIGVVISLVTLAGFHAAIPRSLRRQHNDVAGFTLAIVGVIYAVLLAFIAVAVWQNYDRAAALLQLEADLAGDLNRDAVGLPDALADAAHREVATYAETVVQLEWPALAGAEAPPSNGWESLDRLHLLLARDRTGDPWVIAVKAEMLRELDSLYDARRNRLESARAELPPVLWWNLLAGAAVVLVFSCLFGVPNIGMHAAMVSLLATSISLVLALILLLYNPYLGRNHISAAPFNALVTALEATGRG